ncbi:TIGR03084 family metal-binding protein [Goodfellowiella coeruleoviolacea]|uniref:TIGR03084 family protein n=1 Tax=Goodfellowiella coeruleoviolacea TaxID=334858 RepID=A0AAE3GFY6_9PSEU|nr:TIGR03084 family metal-binding protein [Goodfellowiella coeruleoviolacea]MCP2166644.1 TIGR03084 family protein [Goodfellowiella coeruleoviolacea]
MTDLASVLADLRAESAELESLVVGLDAPGLATPTPAPGWTVAHQLSHLCWTDQQAVWAATDPAGFSAHYQHISPEQLGERVEAGAAEGVGRPPADLLADWRAGRDALADALRALPADTRVVWFGPAMSPTSMATARLMETWAHGQDIADALGRRRRPTARLRHVAHLGVRTFGHAFRTHGQPVPDEPVRVELRGPDGESWTWGPTEAANRVTGPALDFCLLVTQRRHRDDLGVRAQGEIATRWLALAQAFAGPPGPGRTPGQFS